MRKEKILGDPGASNRGSELTDLETDMSGVEARLQNLKRRWADGEFQGFEGKAKLQDEPNDLETKLIRLRSKGRTTIRDLQSKIRSEFRDFWDFQLKIVNNLMIAHAAGLVTCVTLLKDYKDNAQIKGIGLFVKLFGYGLTAAIVAFAILLLHRLLLFGSGVSVSGEVDSKKAFRDIRLASIAYSISCALLLASVVVAIWKSGSL